MRITCVQYLNCAKQIFLAAIHAKSASQLSPIKRDFYFKDLKDFEYFKPVPVEDLRS
jgi:hypothetical protein